MFTVGLSEIVLVVKDVNASANFYREVVCLAPERVNGKWAWFWAGEQGQSQHVAVTEGPLGLEDKSPHPEGKRWGHVHYAFHVPREELEAAAEHVRKQRARISSDKTNTVTPSRSYSVSSGSGVPMVSVSLPLFAGTIRKHAFGSLGSSILPRASATNPSADSVTVNIDIAILRLAREAKKQRPIVDPSSRSSCRC